jgi:indolepyruvate ferredoxin oxidoreductase beta subunit
MFVHTERWKWRWFKKMSQSQIGNQQIIVSGVGGQGVLFITKVLAETALDMGYSVLISETHGMAQRGGIVISHLKVGMRPSEGEPDSSDTAPMNRPEGSGHTGPGTVLISPLIRPGRADVLLALHPDGFRAHAFYLKPGGKVFRNAPDAPNEPDAAKGSSLNATAIATELGSPVSANLVLLGFAAGSGQLFCGPDQLEKTIGRYGGKRLEGSLKAYRAGLGRSRSGSRP